MKKYAGAVIDGPLLGSNIVHYMKTFETVTMPRPKIDAPDGEQIEYKHVLYKFDEKLEVWRMQK